MSGCDAPVGASRRVLKQGIHFLIMKPELARLLALAAGLLAGVVPCTAAASEGSTLTVFTWSDYMDPEAVSAFERETGARVRFEYYETDDLRDRKMAQTDGRGVDVIVVNGASLSAYVRRGWIAPTVDLPMRNLGHVDPRWRSAFPDAEAYGVPYFWGTVGIAYRTDLVPGPLLRWRDLFEPEEALRGRIVMIRSTRDLMGMALKSLGFSANSGDAAELARAGALLAAQKPYVLSYSYLALTERSKLVTGEAWAAIAYNGDAMALMEIDPRIAYVVPEEGSNLWVDYLTLSAASVRKPLAARFIDFLNRPDVAASNARFVHYASPNTAAIELLPDDFRGDTDVFPDAETLARSEIYRELPPRAMKRANAAVAGIVH